MSFVRPMTALDLFRFNPCNLDHLTETYTVSFYFEYLSRWPDLCQVLESHDGTIEGYMLAKIESSPWAAPVTPYSPSTNPDANYLPWHGHITALSIAPHARRIGHASKLSMALEDSCNAQDAWFIDLFVREENVAAQKLYRSLGYSVYRRVVEYYNDDTDAFDMRKPLLKDKHRGTIREDGENVLVAPADVW